MTEESRAARVTLRQLAFVSLAGFFRSALRSKSLVAIAVLAAAAVVLGPERSPSRSSGPTSCSASAGSPRRSSSTPVAVGQITPGPLFTSATFIGFLVAGLPGAAVATVAIFLPAFVFVALSGPIIPRIRRSASAGAVLDGVNAASVALMAVVSVELARAAIVDLPTALLAAAALAAPSFTRVGSVWLMLAGGVVGLAVR